MQFGRQQQLLYRENHHDSYTVPEVHILTYNVQHNVYAFNTLVILFIQVVIKTHRLGEAVRILFRRNHNHEIYKEDT